VFHPHLPNRFHELQPQTNLRQPPSNWLKRDERLGNVTHQHPMSWAADVSDFSSFAIADRSLDSVGSVDVVSDAENIKKVFFFCRFRSCWIAPQSWLWFFVAPEAPVFQRRYEHGNSQDWQYFVGGSG